MATKRIAGPAFLAASATNIYSPPNAAVFIEIRHIHLFNVTSLDATFSLWVGATGGSAAGTELFKAMTIKANKPFDYYCKLKMVSTDFLSGLASVANSVVIVVEGDYQAT